MHDHSHDTDDVLKALWDDVSSHEGAGRAHALCHLGEYFFHHGEMEDALAAADAAKELFLAADEVDEAAHCDHNAAVALRLLGRFDDAVARHEDAVAGHMAGEWARAAACCRMHLATLHEEAGRLDEARTQLRAADEEFERLGHVGLQGEALLGRSRIALKRGRFAPALQAAVKALPLLEAGAPVPMVADGHVAAAKALTVLGRCDKARMAWRRARAIYEAIDDESSVAECDLGLVELLVLDQPSDPQTMQTLLEMRAERKAEGDLESVASIDMLRGRVLLDVDPAAALQLFDDAEAVARACAEQEVAAEADMRAGFALVRLGDVEAGVRRIRRGRRVLERLHRVDLVAEARLFVMRLHVADGDQSAARHQAVALHGLLEHSGLKAVLREVIGVRGVPKRPAPSN